MINRSGAESSDPARLTDAHAAAALPRRGLLRFGAALALMAAPAAGAEGVPLAAVAQAMADALDAELRQAEAALQAAAAALDPGPPARPPAPTSLPLATLDRAVRGTAASLGLPVMGFDSRLAPLVDSAVPPGTPLPAPPAAELAADALEQLRPVLGRLGEGEGGLAVAVPVLRGAGGRPLAVLVATLTPERIGAVLLGAVRGGGVLAARLAALPEGSAAEAPVEPGGASTIAWARRDPAAEAAAASLPGAAIRLRQEPRWAVLVTGPTPAMFEEAPPAELPGPTPAAAGWWGSLGPSAGAALLGAIGAGLVGRLRGRRPGPAARRDAEEARRALSELRAICDTIPVGLALLDAAECRLLSANQRLSAFAGLPTDAMAGRLAADVLPPPLSEAIAAGHAQVLREGRPVMDAQISVEASGMLRHTRHLLVSCHPVRAVGGRIEAVSAVVQDITERARAEAGRDLLVRELNHRVKNSLATVQTIAHQTVRGAADLGEFERSFGARIRALARAHDLLTVNSWRDADLLSVARAALSPWLEDPRLQVEGGPDVLLRPAQAQALVLAFHELATNAAKYGSLTRDEGRVRVRWSLDPDGLATLRWLESGGPEVAPKPARRGFGMRLLEQALSRDLGAGAEPTLTFDPEGLRAAIRFRPGGVLAARVAA
jgi:PAS domain S-box-containing protein